MNFRKMPNECRQITYLCHMKKQAIELLSPAKDIAVGRAAIDHGADAVYIGGPGFSAREKAANSIQDIEKLCRYAALYDAKVYVTLNTILFDHELEGARQLAYDCWNAGVDALIVQDMALLEMDLPPVPLHASTQCDNMTPEKVRFLEQVGFSQVVLARELDLQQIKEIRKQTRIPLEFFIHGSLCVCRSGQCYLSQYLGNRSANRGACAQPCRLPWNMLDADGRVLVADRHLLSLRDLNNSAHVEQLIDVGVTSFKIEGRLKDADYVKNITAYYRRCLDQIIDRRTDLRQASRGHCTYSFEINPEKSFYRGFTDYFIEGRKQNIDSPYTPKSMGEYIGEVRWCNSLRMEIDTGKALHNGDGLCYLDAKKELQGLRADVVNGATVSCNRPHGAVRGTAIYRNFDIEWQRQVEASKDNRKIDIGLVLAENDAGYVLTALIEEEFVAVAFSIESEHVVANNPEKAMENIRRKALQWGDTVFNPIRLDLQFSQYYLIPASVIGEMKRGLVRCLSEQLIERHLSTRKQAAMVPNTVPYPETELSYLGNVVNQKAAAFYRRHGVSVIEDGLELSLSKAEGTQLMHCKHCIRYSWGMCSKETGQKAVPLFLQNQNGIFRLEFDCRNCQMKVCSVSSPTSKEGVI